MLVIYSTMWNWQVGLWMHEDRWPLLSEYLSVCVCVLWMSWGRNARGLWRISTVWHNINILSACVVSFPPRSVCLSINLCISPLSLLSEILPHPASHYLKKCVYSSLLYSFSQFLFLPLLLFICYPVSLTHPLSGSWFEYLSCCKSKSMHHNPAPLHFWITFKCTWFGTAHCLLFLKAGTMQYAYGAWYVNDL